MSPVFQQPRTIPPAVHVEAAAILQIEGAYHVAGRYIPCATDAATVRQIEAERRVTQRERQRRLMATCVWCNTALTATDTPVEIGGRNLHVACADEFDRHAYGEAA
jgi:hypothetical protein